MKSPLPYNNAMAPRSPFIIAETQQVLKLLGHVGQPAVFDIIEQLLGYSRYLSFMICRTRLQSVGCSACRSFTSRSPCKKGLPLGIKCMAMLYNFVMFGSKNA